ncbi:unnamed protein product [Coffea canephora]|uniref:Glycosyltransferase 61 catalytic domain-containing protein n=1 Tax=Coffea canephora TaxID=49390 RepID=A0A068TM39_COFCA|nr:unnamed protein product [Coffea canephora]
MAKGVTSEPERIASSNLNNKPRYSKQHTRSSSSKISQFLHYSPKLSLYFLVTFTFLLILFQIQPLQIPSLPPTTNSWTFMSRWQNVINNTNLSTLAKQYCAKDLESTASKLRDAVTFLPLKDLRYTSSAQQGHTWFMSSMYDTHEEGEVQYQQFPSEASKGRLLCLKGRDTHEGAWNSYALAWPDTLPHNATLLKGLTFVSYNHYNYDNIWHGLSAMVPFVAWHIKNGCAAPTRWVLYHWGELRMKMGPWLRALMEATFGEPLYVEGFTHDQEVGGPDDHGNNDDDDDENPFCFEEAVVMRHNEGGMSRQRRIEVYDLLRCKARIYCNVSIEGRNAEADEKAGVPVIGMTMFMRTGARSFRNPSAVIAIFEKECNMVEACRFRVAYSNNLTFCEQVKLMSSTDILISPHGAQLTNMFLMDRNSNVLEFFPKGWLKLAGVGQYVYHWIASWSGMKHQGAWRDPDGEKCPYPEDDRRCMSIFKSGLIGHNQTYFSEWARNVLDDVKMRKMEELASLMKKNSANTKTTIVSGCPLQL